ncbi:MAG: amino acid permease-associated region, partial [uncultured Solirubrobacteraceae bacterium]
GSSSPSRPGAGAGRQRARRDGIRERRLVDLLRARPGRLVRTGPDARRLRHHGPVLLLHRGHLRRGDGHVPRGGRRVQLRPAGVQRVLVLLLGVGPDAQLRHHGRHLGVLPAALPRRRVRLRGAASDLARRHPLRSVRDRAAVGGECPGRQGVGGHQHPPGGRRLPHAADARARRRDAGALSRDAGRQHPVGCRPDVGAVPAGDPDRDDRLHRHRDDLEHGRGGARRDADDPEGHQPGAGGRVRDLLHVAGGGAVGAAGRARPRDGRVPDAARCERGGGGLCRQPDHRRGRADGVGRPPAARGALRRAGGRDHPVPGHQRRADRLVAARLLDGDLPAAAGPRPAAAPALPDPVDRHPHLRRCGGARAASRSGGLPGADVRVRRHAVVHDRARGRAPAASNPAGLRPPVSRSREPPRTRLRPAGLRFGGRAGHRHGIPGGHRAEPRHRRRGNRLVGPGNRRLRRIPPSTGARSDFHPPGRDAQDGDRARGGVRLGPGALRRRQRLRPAADRHRDQAGRPQAAGHPRPGDHRGAQLQPGRRAAAPAGDGGALADRAGPRAGRRPGVGALREDPRRPGRTAHHRGGAAHARRGGRHVAAAAGERQVALRAHARDRAHRAPVPGDHRVDAAVAPIRGQRRARPSGGGLV